MLGAVSRTDEVRDGASAANRDTKRP